ncbi:SDR family NAD(P)-dependent oxidoreductase [Streptomyces yangpuensis]|uniref:SDR family NAD(P)-dependent oxidoreductase n=1 Tax=Streptomyces yangpuensis TaxID=1648182 RepID=UPI000ABB4E73|nr:SDR family NAD(P)-dependent oxidoreductase [Streptomyces yangpuensis]
MRDAVVVVTGASSGVGRATALQCAGRGARVVLAARSAARLREVARECRRRGGEGYAVPTDVADEMAVCDLAAAAVARFGSIDVWVNAAGMGIPVPLDQTPGRDLRRLLGVNVLGAVHGARAAVPVMQRQGRGVVIDIASLLGTVVEAQFVGGYAMSTTALVTFDEVLREELASIGEHRIAVCTILPSGPPSPIGRRTAERRGSGLGSASVGPAERIARAVVRTAVRPRNQVLVGPYEGPLAAAHVLAPATMRRVVAWRTDRNYFGAGAGEPHSSGSRHGGGRRRGERLGVCRGSLWRAGRRVGRAAAMTVVRAAVRHHRRGRNPYPGDRAAGYGFDGPAS